MIDLKDLKFRERKISEKVEEVTFDCGFKITRTNTVVRGKKGVIDREASSDEYYGEPECSMILTDKEYENYLKYGISERGYYQGHHAADVYKEFKCANNEFTVKKSHHFTKLLFDDDFFPTPCGWEFKEDTEGFEICEDNFDVENLMAYLNTLKRVEIIDAESGHFFWRFSKKEMKAAWCVNIMNDVKFDKDIFFSVLASNYMLGVYSFLKEDINLPCMKYFKDLRRFMDGRHGLRIPNLESVIPISIKHVMKHKIHKSVFDI